MRKLMSRILHGKPSEEARLLASAIKFPRYKQHRFHYRNFIIEVTDFLSVAWQIQEYFGDQRMAFTTNVKNPVIIDCGSNVGISALYFKSLFPNSLLYCYEADPKLAELLRKNLKFNKIETAEINQKVVWTHSDGVSFGLEGADGGSVHNNKNSMVLPSIRLKNVLMQFESVELLKIDIEGAEVEVLKDCAEALSRVNFLYVEYHSLKDQPQKLDELLYILKENGFRYYLHRIGNYHAQPFLKIEDHSMDVQLDIHAVRK